MNKRFNEKKIGFRTICSSVLAIADIVERLRFNMSTERFCIFLDFSKAFDIVNHDLMIQKLGKYGVRGAILSWFRSYFLNLQQTVFINGAVSDIKVISSGVLQY